jgi:hypothetical protein
MPVDADMGAYYTWLNQQRLRGASNPASWSGSKTGSQALAIAPGLKPDTIDSPQIDLPTLLHEHVIEF